MLGRKLEKEDVCEKDVGIWGHTGCDYYIGKRKAVRDRCIGDMASWVIYYELG